MCLGLKGPQATYGSYAEVCYGCHPAALHPSPEGENFRTATAADSPIILIWKAVSGASVANGIQTFQKGGCHWTVGSETHPPHVLATIGTWKRYPEDIWLWSLDRRGQYQAAQPNAAHHAVAAMQRLLPGHMTLVTLNVDGLHPRACPLCILVHSPSLALASWEWVCRVCIQIILQVSLDKVRHAYQKIVTGFLVGV